MTEPARDPNIQTLAPELRAHLDALRPSDDSFLPAVVVEMQRTLARFSANELMHLIVAGAVQLAARNVSAPGPAYYLGAAAIPADGMSGDAWRETVGPEVRRLCHATWEEHGHAPEFPDNEPEPATEEGPADAVAPPPPPDS